MINLGISFSGEHDTSCSLVIDKKLVFAISEERLTRVKQDGSFPVNSINACLQYADLNPHQVDNVTIAWSEPKKQLYFDTQFSLKNKS